MVLPLPSLIRRAGSAALVLIVLDLLTASRSLFDFFLFLAFFSCLLGSSRDDDHSLLLLLSLLLFTFLFDLLLNGATWLLDYLNSLLDSLLSRSTLGYIRSLNFSGVVPHIGAVLASTTVRGFLFLALSTSLSLIQGAPSADLYYLLRGILLFNLLALLGSCLRCLHYDNCCLGCLLCRSRCLSSWLGTFLSCLRGAATCLTIILLSART